MDADKRGLRIFNRRYGFAQATPRQVSLINADFGFMIIHLLQDARGQRITVVMQKVCTAYPTLRNSWTVEQESAVETLRYLLLLLCKENVFFSTFNLLLSTALLRLLPQHAPPYFRWNTIIAPKFGERMKPEGWRMKRGFLDRITGFTGFIIEQKITKGTKSW